MQGRGELQMTLNAVTSEGTTRGRGRDNKRSCDEMGVEVLGNATTNQTRGAQQKVEA